MWSKAILCRFRQSGKIPQVQVSQGFAAFRLAPSRIAPRHSQTRRDTNFAIPGYSISAIIPRRGRKSKIFLSVVIPVVKAAFVPLSATGESPANAGVARLCGVSPHPIPDTATALPNQARYQLRYTRILFQYTTAAGGREEKILVYINKVVIGGRLPADDDLIQICIKHLACCALRQREGDIRAEKVGVDGQVEAAALQLHQAPCDG